MTVKLQQLAEPIEVRVVSSSLPKGMTACNRLGSCIAWWMSEETCLWLVSFDQTGELVWVPMAEIRLRPNWTARRRFVDGAERAAPVQPAERPHASEPNEVSTGRVREILHGPDRHAVLVVGGVELTPQELWALQDGLARGHRVEVGR